MSDGSQAIWTPDGVHVLGKPVERVELRAALMEWFVQFADFAEHFALGIHCSKCGKDVIGKNADTARVLAVVCGCREFVGLNRDVAKAPNPATMTNSFLGRS